MKKLLAFVLALLMVLSLASCGGKTEKEGENIPPEADGSMNSGKEDLPSDGSDDGKDRNVKTILEAYLDGEGFVYGMTQSVFLDKMEGYLYKGQPITDIALGCYYDSEKGGGYSASHDLFGFLNDYSVNEDDRKAVSTNKFYTGTALEGFSLPFGITFEDTLEEAFEKMAFDDPRESFAADEGSDTNMTLAGTKDTKDWCVVYKNLKRTKDPVEYKTPHRICYSETYTAPLANGQMSTVIREMTLCFFDEGLEGKETLASITITVKTEYAIK